MTNQYQKEYSAFMSKFEKGVTDAEETGELIGRLAEYFAETNKEIGKKWREIVAISKEINSRTDDFSGKPIAVNKAEILLNATPEAMDLNDLKIDRENIQEMINALKALQKGQTNEYHHNG